MNEIDILVAKLNDLQGRAYKNFRLTGEEKNEWRETTRQVRSSGYVLKHRKGRDGVVKWWAVKPDDVCVRNSECPYIYTDVRPNDGYRTLRGDCTSRAMAFVLQGTMTYRQIESEQYALAARKNVGRGRYCAHVRRNSNEVWDLVILNRGWVKITLNRQVKRSVLGKYLAGKINAPVISLSRGHVAVIDQNGAVRDTWDSRGGRVYAIYAKREEVETITRVVGGLSLKIVTVKQKKQLDGSAVFGHNTVARRKEVQDESCGSPAIFGWV